MHFRAHFLLAVVLGSGTLLSNATGAAQQQPRNPKNAARKAPPLIPAMQEPVKIRAVPALAAGTEIPLVLTHEVKVKQVHAGDKADFVLGRDLWYRDMLLAPRGTPVQVVVQKAAKARWLSRGSRLGFSIQSLKLLDGSLVPLRGEPDYRGGINSFSGGAFSATTPGGDTGAMVGGAAMLAGVFGLVAPGKNVDAKAGARADAWVKDDFRLNIDSLRGAQPARDPAATTGKLQVVRGVWEKLKSRDLYCNGVPLAHLAAGRKYVADLQPGWYRFAIGPKVPAVEFYVVAGEVYTLVSLPDVIQLVDPEFSAGATGKYKFARGLEPRTARQMVNEAKSVDSADVYGDSTGCAPLAEAISPPAEAAGKSPIAGVRGEVEPSATPIGR